MKKIYIFFFVCISYLTTAQKIEGIGIFKVGKTEISVIDSLSQNGYGNIVDCQSRIDVKCLNARIMKPARFESPWYERDKIEENVVVVIRNYKVSDIMIPIVQLNFFNGLLYRVRTRETPVALGQAVLSKYGKIDYEYIEKGVECNSLYGRVTLLEKDYITIYRNDDKISAEQRFSIYHNNRCDEKSSDVIDIIDLGIKRKIDEMWMKKHEEEVEKEKINEKERLKDL